MTCRECPDMRPGSSSDGAHLFCERFGVWTNLLQPWLLGRCVADWRTVGEPRAGSPGQARAGEQLALW